MSFLKPAFTFHECTRTQVRCSYVCLNLNFYDKTLEAINGGDLKTLQSMFGVDYKKTLCLEKDALDKGLEYVEEEVDFNETLLYYEWHRHSKNVAFVKCGIPSFLSFPQVRQVFFSLNPNVSPLLQHINYYNLETRMFMSDIDIKLIHIDKLNNIAALNGISDYLIEIEQYYAGVLIPLAVDAVYVLSYIEFMNSPNPPDFMKCVRYYMPQLNAETDQEIRFKMETGESIVYNRGWFTSQPDTIANGLVLASELYRDKLDSIKIPLIQERITKAIFETDLDMDITDFSKMLMPYSSYIEGVETESACVVALKYKTMPAKNIGLTQEAKPKILPNRWLLCIVQMDDITLIFYYDKTKTLKLVCRYADSLQKDETFEVTQACVQKIFGSLAPANFIDDGHLVKINILYKPSVTVSSSSFKRLSEKFAANDSYYAFNTTMSDNKTQITFNWIYVPDIITPTVNPFLLWMVEEVGVSHGFKELVFTADHNYNAITVSTNVAGVGLELIVQQIIALFILPLGEAQVDATQQVFDRKYLSKNLTNFDVKSFYSVGKTKYSQKCPHNNQPLIIGAQKKETFTEDEQKRIFTFWNNERNKPTLLMCPKEAPYVKYFLFNEMLKEKDGRIKMYCTPCCAQQPEKNADKIKNKQLCQQQGWVYKPQNKNNSRTSFVIALTSTNYSNRIMNLPPALNQIFHLHGYYLYGPKEMSLKIPRLIEAVLTALNVELGVFVDQCKKYYIANTQDFFKMLNINPLMEQLTQAMLFSDKFELLLEQYTNGDEVEHLIRRIFVDVYSTELFFMYDSHSYSPSDFVLKNCKQYVLIYKHMDKYFIVAYVFSQKKKKNLALIHSNESLLINIKSAIMRNNELTKEGSVLTLSKLKALSPNLSKVFLDEKHGVYAMELLYKEPLTYYVNFAPPEPGDSFETKVTVFGSFEILIELAEKVGESPDTLVVAKDVVIGFSHKNVKQYCKDTDLKLKYTDTKGSVVRGTKVVLEWDEAVEDVLFDYRKHLFDTLLDVKTLVPYKTEADIELAKSVAFCVYGLCYIYHDEQLKKSPTHATIKKLLSSTTKESKQSIITTTSQLTDTTKSKVLHCLENNIDPLSVVYVDDLALFYNEDINKVQLKIRNLMIKYITIVRDEKDLIPLLDHDYTLDKNFPLTKEFSKGFPKILAAQLTNPKSSNLIAGFVTQLAVTKTQIDSSYTIKSASSIYVS